MTTKSRSSTQHAFMKLLLVVAILISTNEVVANSTSELVEHRRLAKSQFLYVEKFKEKWNKDFKDHVAQFFNYGKTNDLLTADQLDEVQNKIKDFKAFPTSTKEFPNMEPGTSKIKLLEIPLYYTNRKGQAEEALEVLMVVEGESLSDVVNIINAGLMHTNKWHRAFAEQVEEKLLTQLDSKGKSLEALFGELKLNEMDDKMRLYLNPAFTTWMKYAFHLKKDPTEAFRSMLAVLKKETEGLDSFRNLQKTKTGSTREEELFEKWRHVYDNRSKWSDFHPTKKMHFTDKKFNRRSSNLRQNLEKEAETLEHSPSLSALKDSVDFHFQ